MIRRWFKILLFVAVIWSAGFFYFTTQLPTEITNIGQAGDGIVVLTGGRDRLPEAIELLSSGRGARLLISGVNADIDDAKLRSILGLPDGASPDPFTCCIDIGREARDTVGNAEEIADWVNRHGFATVRVVTASYHMPRSLAEIERQTPDLIVIPHPVFPNHVKVSAWWRYPGTAKMLASEYNKYVVSVFKLHVMDPVLSAATS